MTEPKLAVAAEKREQVCIDQVICEHESCIVAKTATAAADPLPLAGAKTSTPPSSTNRDSTGKLTRADKQDLIKYYTGLFAKSFRKWIASPRGEVAAANREVRLRAKDNQYASIPAMHADYETLLRRHCESGIENDVYENWVNFCEVEGYWWGKCINLSSQRKRRGFIRKVVEQIKTERFDPEAFKDEYREYYGLGFNEGESESEDDD